MKISISDFRAVQVVFRPSAELLDYLQKITDRQEILSLKISALLPTQEDKEFFIHFAIAIDKDTASFISDDSTFHIDYMARFETDEPLPNDFIKSDFAKISAPAIAFPFLRAWVSNFFTSSGYDPVILPAYNFSTNKFTDEDELSSESE